MKVLAITLALAGLASTAPLNAQIVSNSRVTGNNGCAYNRTTNSVGDVIYGRANSNVCRDVYTRDTGAWYQVGQGENNNSIYERRTVDTRGNLVIQRGRRNSNGSFTILSTRVASTNDKQWKKAQKEQQKQQNNHDNQKNHDNHR